MQTVGTCTAGQFAASHFCANAVKQRQAPLRIIDVGKIRGDWEMSASSEVRRIAVRTGMLIAGVFVVAVLLSAMPGHRVPVVGAQEQQNSGAGQSMQGMDHSKMQMPDADEQASEKDAMADMAHMHGANPHMTMTAMRVQTSADVQKANEIVAQLKNGIEKYRDY